MVGFGSSLEQLSGTVVEIEGKKIFAFDWLFLFVVELSTAFAVDDVLVLEELVGVHVLDGDDLLEVCVDDLLL